MQLPSITGGAESKYPPWISPRHIIRLGNDRVVYFCNDIKAVGMALIGAVASAKIDIEHLCVTPFHKARLVAYGTYQDQLLESFYEADSNCTLQGQTWAVELVHHDHGPEIQILYF